MTDVTNREIDALTARLGLSSLKSDVSWTPSDPVGDIDFRDDDGTLQEFVYRLNRIMDRLDTTDAQATRWRTQRDEALAKVEALEKQNDMLAKELARLLTPPVFSYKDWEKAWEKGCEHLQTVGTVNGWLCCKCGHFARMHDRVIKP